MKNLWALRYVFLLLVTAGLTVAFVFSAVWSYPVCAAAAVGALVALYFVQTWRIKRKNERRGWRVRCVEAGRWAYEEKKDGEWDGIRFDELGDYRESPHIVGLPDRMRWATFPAWISGRRDEVVARIRTELRSPMYEIREG